MCFSTALTNVTDSFSFPLPNEGCARNRELFELLLPLGFNLVFPVVVFFFFLIYLFCSNMELEYLKYGLLSEMLLQPMFLVLIRAEFLLLYPFFFYEISC